MDVLLAPDVYVNASVALGSPPEKVVQRLFSSGKHRGTATPWIMERVRAMLSAVPEFKPDAVEAQVSRIESLVAVVKDARSFEPDEWEQALAEAAKKASTDRVITDHPDLLALNSSTVEFVSTEAWLLEQAMPPPPPAG